MFYRSAKRKRAVRSVRILKEQKRGVGHAGYKVRHSKNLRIRRMHHTLDRPRDYMSTYQVALLKVT